MKTKLGFHKTWVFLALVIKVSCQEMADVDLKLGRRMEFILCDVMQCVYVCAGSFCLLDAVS